MQSNTNSKTIVLSNTIIHPNELTGIGMRGIIDNQNRSRLSDKHIPMPLEDHVTSYKYNLNIPNILKLLIEGQTL
jgi:hypothetical protein